ncbi:homeobox-leucine zipper protein HAT2-like [Lotus japonicus]|uniref:homeobox-leucine zipper protein HAT2-like n=1 Tax=Lotus japonicus TaxID=34305 RepID=UPI00258C2680|nr:homeobox-leucine zipper protein HAT2-like [Lotus japonicus]
MVVEGQHEHGDDSGGDWRVLDNDDDRDSETCRGGEGGFYLGGIGIDVNRLPSGVDCEDEAGVSSPNSTVSSVNDKRSEREGNGEERDVEERDCSRGISDEDDDGGETSRKKLRLSKDQAIVLGESFKEHNTLNPEEEEDDGELVMKKFERV